MPGAIIPDDWDGVTFNCQKVIWPSSVLWRAILLGQLTEPERESFWDEDFGVVADAVQAVKDAETLTSPEFWTEDCDVIPGHPISAFLAYSTSDFVLAPSAWQTIPWDVLLFDFNNPGFQLAQNGHHPIVVGKPGLWHYDIQIAVPVAGIFHAARAWLTGPNIELGRQDFQLYFTTYSFNHHWDEDEQPLLVQVFASSASSVLGGRQFSWFSGHYLGEP